MRLFIISIISLAIICGMLFMIISQPNQLLEKNDFQYPFFYNDRILVNDEGNIFISNGAFRSIHSYNSRGEYLYTIKIDTSSSVFMYLKGNDEIYLAPGRSDNIFVIDNSGNLKNKYEGKISDILPSAIEGKREYITEYGIKYSLTKISGITCIRIKNGKDISYIKIAENWHILVNWAVLYSMIILLFFILKIIEYTRIKSGRINSNTNEELECGLVKTNIKFIKYYKIILKNRLSLFKKQHTNIKIDENIELYFSKSESIQFIVISLVVALKSVENIAVVSILDIISDKNIGQLLFMFFIILFAILLDISLLRLRYECGLFQKRINKDDYCHFCKGIKPTFWDYFMNKRSANVVCNKCNREYKDTKIKRKINFLFTLVCLVLIISGMFLNMINLSNFKLTAIPIIYIFWLIFIILINFIGYIFLIIFKKFKQAI